MKTFIDHQNKTDKIYFCIDVIEFGKVAFTWVYSEFDEALHLFNYVMSCFLRKQDFINSKVLFSTVSSNDPEIPIKDIILNSII